MSEATTLFEKIWRRHLVRPETAETPAVLYIDLHIIHEVTTPQAFSVLRDNGIAVRRPDLTLATLDHSTPTTPVSTFKDLLVAGEPLPDRTAAITFDDGTKVAVINEALCKGCGTCVAACPAGAIQGKGFTDEQIYAEIDGILA